MSKRTATMTMWLCITPKFYQPLKRSTEIPVADDERFRIIMFINRSDRLVYFYSYLTDKGHSMIFRQVYNRRLLSADAHLLKEERGSDDALQCFGLCFSQYH